MASAPYDSYPGGYPTAEDGKGGYPAYGMAKGGQYGHGGPHDDGIDHASTAPGGGPVSEQPPDIRRGFIRKVFGILAIQLIVTMGIVALFAFSEGARAWVVANPWTLILAFVLVFAMIITLACCRGVARKYPTNMICLALFTLAEGFLVGVSAARYAPSVIFTAVLATVIIVLALTAFASQTRIDFTRLNGIMFVVLLVFIIFGICMSFFPADQTLNLVFAAIGCLIFSVYLVIDVQMVIGGTHKIQFGLDDYVFAALNLYLDIINLFLFLLSIIGGGGRR